MKRKTFGGTDPAGNMIVRTHIISINYVLLPFHSITAFFDTTVVSKKKKNNGQFFKVKNDCIRY